MDRAVSNLFQSGTFTLASGRESSWKIECDALCGLDWETLARIGVELLPPFGTVIGVPRGGWKFAQALERYVTNGPTLVVDDVYTTGRSIARCMGFGMLGLVAFARVKPPSSIRAIFVYGGQDASRN